MKTLGKILLLLFLILWSILCYIGWYALVKYGLPKDADESSVFYLFILTVINIIIWSFVISEWLGRLKN